MHIDFVMCKKNKGGDPLVFSALSVFFPKIHFSKRVLWFFSTFSFKGSFQNKSFDFATFFRFSLTKVRSPSFC